MASSAMLSNSRVSNGFWAPTRHHDETGGDGGKRMIRRINRRREREMFRAETREFLRRS